MSRKRFWCSFCTRLIDSTPPATATGTRSTITRWAAIAIAWRPEEQKRLTVVAGGGHRQPGAERRLARDVVARRALGHGAPDDDVLDLGRVEPARWTACSMTCPARVAPWVLLNAPRYALPMGVRAVETITASAMVVLLARRGPARGCRRRAPGIGITVPQPSGVGTGAWPGAG